MNTPRAARPDKTENPQADEIAALRQRVAQLEAQLDAASQGPATRDSDAQARTLQSLEKTDRSRQVLLNILEDQKRTEDKLRASEQRLREAQRLAGIGSWVLDLTSRCLTWSDEMFNILDIDRADFSGGFPDFLSAIHPDDRERVDREYTASVAQRTPYDTIHRLRLKDGSIKHLHLCCHTHYAEDGSPLHSMGTVQDITERLLAEKQREALLQRLEEAQRIGNIGSWEWNLQTRQGTWSRELYRILGRDPVLDPPSFKVLLQHVHPDDLEDFEAQLHDSLETGVFEVEFRCLRHDDQSVRSLSARGKVEFDTDGKPLRHFGVAMDISRRKQTEEQLRKLAQAVEQSPESTVITNLDAEIEYVNEAFLRTTGFRRDEVLGQNPRILQSSSTPRQTYESLWASLTRGLPWQGEFHNKRKNGGEFIERALIVPVRNQQGTITHYVGVSQDITEHKRLDRELDAYRHRLEERVAERTAQLAEARQKAEAASGAKSAFLANMSHEIRTPMNAIMGLTHILQRDAPTPRQAERLKKIMEAGNHLLSVINDILDLSKIEAGKLKLVTSDFSLDALFDYVRSLVREQAKVKQLQFELDTGNVPLWLHGDTMRLRQALLNYVSNAVKFTENGRIVMRARMLRRRDDELLIRFEVQDSGIGIDANKLAGLFEVFQQADASTTRKYGGSGLGLAITRRLASIMGGETGAASQKGHGSLFWFTAWLRIGQAHRPNEQENLTAGGDELSARSPGARILLVEDNATNREVAEVLLSSVGLTVECAENGRQALSMMRRQAYDLVLMDIQMPIMDGLEATRIIRSLDTHKQLPILAMTANVFEEDRQACREAGMDDFVAKPVEPRALFATLAKWLPKIAEPKTHATPGNADADPALRAHLAALPGLDLETGLRNLRGDLRGYARLLRQFDAAHHADMQTLRGLLHGQDEEQTRRLTHTLKGAAGALSLTALYQAAKALDAQLRKHPEMPPDMLIEQVSGEQTRLHRALIDLPPIASAPAVDAAPEKTRRLLGQLIRLLKANDAAANALFFESQATLTQIHGARVERLGRHIESFDYQAALEIARALLSESGGTGPR